VSNSAAQSGFSFLFAFLSIPIVQAVTDPHRSPDGEEIIVEPTSDAQHRRTFVAAGTMLVMGGGLAAGYGTFFVMAGRYLFPSGANRAWLFVTDAASIPPGGSLPFESPGGVKVTIKRQSERVAGDEIRSEEFVALSSICPHLGCRVHWEPQNNRFFCPCHNGVFDPEGHPVSGPPAAAHQSLPQYPLQIVDGGLYIEMPRESLGGSA
jgi:Rieske Fe-S protein